MTVNRRSLLVGTAAAVGGGAAVAVALPYVTEPEAAPPPPVAAGPAGAEAVPFHGPHQAGITTPVQAHAVFLGLDLRAGTDRDGVRRLLRALTDDATRLTAGRPPLGAADGEIPALPSRLTVTVGFGPGLFDALGVPDACPAAVRVLPAFPTDRLDPRWSGGDLLLQVCSDDPLPLSYAVRRLVRTARGSVTVRWTQRGFTTARGSEPPGSVARNLMGHRDGVANPVGPELEQAVWITEGPDWLVGGSTLVLRRIRMDLDIWDDFSRQGKDASVARRMDTGADVPDADRFALADGAGVRVPGSPHAPRARARTPAERMLRRAFSFDDGPTAEGLPDAGLLFAAFQVDPAAAFVPVQQRLAESDAMNAWVTHVGSAAFVIPPGCPEGRYVGQALCEP